MAPDRQPSGGPAARAAQPIVDSTCPYVDRGDLNCDGFDDALDLGYMIGLLFADGPPPCNP